MFRCAPNPPAPCAALGILLGLVVGGCTGQTPTDATPADVSADLNPTVGSVFTVRWTQPALATTWVEYRVADEERRSTPPRAVEAGSAEQIVLGVPFAETATYRVVAEVGGAQSASPELTLDTAPFPERLPLPEPAVGDPDRYNPSTPYFFTSISQVPMAEPTTFVIILDRQGRVVWALESPEGTASPYPRIARDGRAFLIDHNTFWTEFNGGVDSSVVRTHIDGTVEATYETPGLHHPFTQLPDGTLAWGAIAVRQETLETLAPDGTRATVWSCGDLLATLGMEPDCGSNALYYDEPSGHFLFSFYSLDSIIDIDSATGQTARWFGRLPDSYTFDPPDSQFWWQHGGNLTEDGTLLLSTHMTESGSEATMMREYALDAPNRTLHQVWSWGDAEADRVYSPTRGEAWRLANGDTLHNAGAVPLLREVTPEGEVVWRLEWPGANEVGRSTPIEDLYALAE